MARYSSGRNAHGFCDRTGFRYPLKDLVYEVVNGKRTGLRVGRDVVDPDHPQLRLGKVRVDDPKPLRDPRPDPALAASRVIWSWNPAGYNPVGMVGMVGGVVVVTTDGA